MMLVHMYLLPMLQYYVSKNKTKLLCEITSFLTSTNHYNLYECKQMYYSPTFLYHALLFLVSCLNVLRLPTLKWPKLIIKLNYNFLFISQNYFPYLFLTIQWISYINLHWNITKYLFIKFIIDLLLKTFFFNEFLCFRLKSNII